MANLPRKTQHSNQFNHNYSNPNHNSGDSYTSSSDQDNSESISIQLKTKIDQIKSKSQPYRIEEELKSLKMQNQDLRSLNKKLQKELKNLNNRFSHLEEFLKQKQRYQNKANLQIQRLDPLQLKIKKLNKANIKNKKRLFQFIEQKGKINNKFEKIKPFSDDNHQNSPSQEAEEYEEGASSSSSVQLHVLNNNRFANDIKSQNVEFQKQVVAWKQRLNFYQRQIKWYNSLTQKMNRMAKQIAYIFDECVWNEQWDMRKRSKASWRYLKHIMRYILSCTE